MPLEGLQDRRATKYSRATLGGETMNINRYAIALALAATVIFATGNIQAQSSVVSAEIHVIGDADVFSLFSNALNAPTATCAFVRGITISRVLSGGAPGSTIAVLGTVEANGSLTVDRQPLLDTLNLQEAVFVGFSTECGGNAGDFGAKAFRAKISRLQHFETARIHTLYFPCGGVPVACNVG